MNLNIIVSILTLSLTFLLSIVVLLEDHKNKTNRYFFLLGFSIVLWILNNILADIVHGYSSALFWARLAIIWVALLPVLFNGLITELYFSQDKLYEKKYKLIRYLSIIIVGIIVLFSQSHFNIDSITLQQSGIDYQPGLLYYLLFFQLLIGFGFGLFYLFKIFHLSRDSKRSQSGFIIAGSLVTVFLGIVTNIIFPLLGYSYLNVIGPPSVLFFVGFTAIAVLKHHLFNVKVIATELLVFSLWLIILWRTLVSINLQEVSINGGLLILTVIIGIFLIRSVVKEVKQREKIQLLATDLQKANDRLTELDKQKSEFVSFATHQLRAPLTAMKGYASLILEGDLGKLSKQIRDAITRIYDSSNTLTNIVDDYLNISRIELGTMKYLFEDVDLKDLVKNVIAELKPSIEKSKLAFSFNADQNKKFVVRADKDKFKQIISNLIDNSMKYTPSGAVTVSLEKKPENGENKIVFSVKDTGIGIDPLVMPKLFAKFSRAENGNRQNIHGTGLGLFVAKEIVSSHKGKIWAESKGEGKGSAFFVELEEVI